MLRTMSVLLALAASAAFSPAVSAQSECGWMPTAKLDELLPVGAPWRVHSGGQVGSCTFLGTHEGGLVLLSATQMVQGSAAEAEKRAKDTGAHMGKTHTVEPIPALGKHGYLYRDESDAARLGLNYGGHKGKVTLIGSLTLPRTEGFPAASGGVVAFFQAALELGDDRRAQRAARACPYVSDRIARKLLAGGKYEMQQYGEDSCVAHNNQGATLILARTPDASADVEAGWRFDECTWSPTPQLAGGHLGTDCTEGNPRAVLWLRVGPDLLNYTFVPNGREPTAAERELLLEIGRKLEVQPDEFDVE